MKILNDRHAPGGEATFLSAARRAADLDALVNGA
jgi:hypothetical protein